MYIHWESAVAKMWYICNWKTVIEYKQNINIEKWWMYTNERYSFRTSWITIDMTMHMCGHCLVLLCEHVCVCVRVSVWHTVPLLVFFVIVIVIIAPDCSYCYIVLEPKRSSDAVRIQHAEEYIFLFTIWSAHYLSECVEFVSHVHYLYAYILVIKLIVL